MERKGALAHAWFGMLCTSGGRPKIESPAGPCLFPLGRQRYSTSSPWCVAPGGARSSRPCGRRGSGTPCGGPAAAGNARAHEAAAPGGGGSSRGPPRHASLLPGASGPCRPHGLPPDGRAHCRRDGPPAGPWASSEGSMAALRALWQQQRPLSPSPAPACSSLTRPAPTGAGVRHRPAAPSGGAGEAEAQAPPPRGFPQLLLHGCEVPGLLHHVSRGPRAGCCLARRIRAAIAAAAVAVAVAAKVAAGNAATAWRPVTGAAQPSGAQH